MIRNLPYGGIYLTGGITETCLDLFVKNKDTFLVIFFLFYKKYIKIKL